MTKQTYNKFAQGIFIVKAKNSSFNSDFSGLPRRLPDENGTIYATDKSLKYCLRKYLKDQGETVFVWRRYDEKSKPLNINENYVDVFGEKPNKKEHSEVLRNLAKAIDVRLFGVTYAGDVNVSLTGTTQLSYGINKLPENVFFSNEILSPYQDANKKDAKQQTLGSETKTLESHYVYDFVINPNTLLNDLKDNEAIERLTQEDINKLKEAFCRSVNYVTSASKIGSESELLLFVEMKSKEDNGLVRSHILPLMKELVEIEKHDGKSIVNLSKIMDALENTYSEYVDNIELYYDNNTTEIKGIDGLDIETKHIVTMELI